MLSIALVIFLGVHLQVTIRIIFIALILYQILNVLQVEKNIVASEMSYNSGTQ